MHWRERIGHGYSVAVETSLPSARSALPAADELVGRPATIDLASSGGTRTISGLVTRCEQRAQEDGTTLLSVLVEPALGPLARRTDLRIFEHASTVEIASAVLSDWSLQAEVRVDEGSHPRHEYRVQYEESDLAFLKRVLQEEGISLILEPPADGGGGPEQIVFDDAPAQREPSLTLRRTTRLLDADTAAYTNLSTRYELHASELSLRDHDFALRADVELAERARSEEKHAPIGSHMLELGSFFVDGASPAEGSNSDLQRGRAMAGARLAALRAGANLVSFETNAMGLHAGAVVRLQDVAEPVLVTHIEVASDHAGDLVMRVEAVDAQRAFRPALDLPRPVARGVQTGRVVGPVGEEIHVDAHGRVRVELVWDRRRPGQRSSCWVRVAQGWAGPGMGLVTIPRVGQSVLVAFLDGDPDQPIIAGRLFDGSSPHPYALPEHATKTSIRTSTTPGGAGHNELTFEDAQGKELVYVRAERDRDSLVRANDRLRIDGNRDKVVGVDETIAVGGGRTARIGTVDITQVGNRFTASMEGGGTYIDMTQSNIRLTTGAASLELDGPNARIVAEGGVDVQASSVIVRGSTNIKIEAGAEVHIQTADGDVVIQGGPMVYLNPSDRGTLDDLEDEDLPVEVPEDVDLIDNIDDAADAAVFDPTRPGGVGDKLAPGGAWDFLGRGEAWRTFHFFHAAAVSSAAGQPLGVILRQEGQRYAARFGANPERGNFGNGVFGGESPYGLEARDHEAIQSGARWYRETYGDE